jgi:hypothetical protein
MHLEGSVQLPAAGPDSVQAGKRLVFNNPIVTNSADERSGLYREAKKDECYERMELAELGASPDLDKARVSSLPFG